ncbi:uncharacterized protein PFLUO_LOCUS6956 [Penicillium psychrofluorescens]|uniref:uncharacterized protein n=1 Tax=Penicillium psychrofluorescens TaxID=3158075 RepID=UPI003CCD387B
MSASVYLPAEVVVNIVEFVFGEDTTFLPDQKEKQRDLRSCCLVSRQWYSASIGFLYHRPCFLKGNSFVQFTNTVCPPVGTRRKRNVDLGSLVHCLDLGGLVHHSSNSLTARLLGRVKKNLEYFVAPRVSFAVNSLPALAKCHKLRYLDLCQIHGEIEFMTMKKAISHLHELDTLFLPPLPFCPSVDEDAAGIWPSSLKCLWLTGVVQLASMPSFVFPPALESLVLQHCRNLRLSVFERILNRPQLESLLSLSLFDVSFYEREDGDSSAIYYLPNLVYLGISWDFLERLLILPSLPLSFFGPLSTLPIKVLEIRGDFYEEEETFDPEKLIKALTSNLSSLRALRLQQRPAFLDSSHAEEIEHLLWRHILALPQERLDDEDLYHEDMGIVISDMAYEEARKLPDVERTIRFPAYRYME